jgi:hypothetical protein
MYNNTRCHIPRDRNLDTALRIWKQVAHRQLMHMVRGRCSSLCTLWCSWHRVSFGFAFICRQKFFVCIRLQHSVVGVATRYGNTIPVVARFSAPVQTGPGAHPAFCTMDTGFLFRGWSGRCEALTTRPHLAPTDSQRTGTYHSPQTAHYRPTFEITPPQIQ